MNKLPFQVGPYDKVVSLYYRRRWGVRLGFPSEAQKPTIYNTIFDLLMSPNEKRIVPQEWYLLMDDGVKYDCCYSKNLLRLWEKVCRKNKKLVIIQT